MFKTQLARTLTTTLCAYCLLSLPLSATAQDDAQQPKEEKKEPVVPEIPDEPRTVDPATLVPAPLAKRVTVDFSESSLREVVKWLQDELKIAVLIDNSALFDEGILLGESVVDRLDNAPVYLMLNRLSALELSWYYEDEILHITTIAKAEERMTTRPYNIGDLLDAGFKTDDLDEAMLRTTNGLWQEIDGEGGDSQLLGDVWFIRQTDEVHLQVQGLIAALRKHGRQTFTSDPPQHQPIREALGKNISVQFMDTPLVSAIAELSKQSNVDIRLDIRSLQEVRVRDREPVSLALTDRKLSTVLQVLTAELKLTWMLKDGVLWITSTDMAEAFEQTAVYDVRDLCQNSDESDRLMAAITTQTAGPWEDLDGAGGVIVFAKDGAMVVRQTQRGLREINQLLATYRIALRGSKIRKREDTSKEVITRYYRMHTDVAADLTTVLPTLISPSSWKSEQAPESPGTILKVASSPELFDRQGRVIGASTGGGGGATAATSQSVLIIRQSRGVHELIAEVIQRVENGDMPEATGGGLGGGGFGGAFFSVPLRQPRSDR